MLKKLIAIFILILSVVCFTACGETGVEAGEKYPGLDKLVDATREIATEYNSIAETAINNGWEYDDETVEQLNRIAAVIDTINAGIIEPESFEDGQIEELTRSAKEIGKELRDIKDKVSDEYEIEGMTMTDAN